MTLSMDKWMKQYTCEVQKLFHDRIWFLGLQGSYGRGEANEHSDIDVVLILDAASVDDVNAYREKVCGFLSGRKEILSWEPSDLFQFCHDTIPILGSLDELMAGIDESDVRRAIRIGACNVYHMCVHNLVHEKNADLLKGLYKSAGFTLQAIAFWQTGSYAKKKTDLLPLLREDDQVVLKTGMQLKEKETLSMEELQTYSERLLNWASKWICEV